MTPADRIAATLRQPIHVILCGSKGAQVIRREERRAIHMEYVMDAEIREEAK